MVEGESALEKNYSVGKYPNKKNIGITAGASAPEIIVKELIKEIKKIRKISISEIKGIEENIVFKLPKIWNSLNIKFQFHP